MLRRSMLLLVAGAGAFAGAASAQTEMKAPAGPEQGAVSQPTVQLAPGVTLAVTELRRVPEKGVMELKFVVANEGQNDVTLKGFGLAYDGELANIAVVDFAGCKQYSIGHAASCLCSTFRERDGGPVPAGEWREFWAWYGLPPGTGTRQMAVQIPDQQPLMNIPPM